MIRTVKILFYYHSYRDYPDVPAQLTRGNTAALNDLDWRANPALVTSLENSVVQSNLNVHCRRENVSST